ncbi:MAG: HAD family hydrolase [Sorangiineae bacterium]|nr:HAD family hydrolase [Polyangiaceae bacterium]MEB2323573.1 HAD family hydrolase [Sorangiineae bacterium]
MSEHDAWLIDLDGTLYHASPVKLMMAAELALSGWTALRTLRAFRREHERLREDPDDAAGSPFARQLERTARGLGLPIEQVEARVETWMIRRPGKWIRLFRRGSLLDEIAAFKARGGRTALVSDYPARVKLAALGATELFEVVIASGEELGPQRLKPAPDGYLAAARELHVEPARCLVIGDRADADGLAAEHAGMAFRHV